MNGKRFFFNAFDALVPEDTNGVRDVYEWEALGTGVCTKADPRYFEVNGGCVHLLSTGESKAGSEFLDASANGGDVFIATQSSLVGVDYGSNDVYDARVGGGLSLPALPEPQCEGEACQSPPSAPQALTPASAIFSGGPQGPGRANGCRALARRARALARKAKRMRRAARRSRARAGAMRRRARRLLHRAKGLSKRVKRCRSRVRIGLRASWGGVPSVLGVHRQGP